MDLYRTLDMIAERVGHGGRTFDPQERVAVFLYRLGGGVGIRQVATQFEVSEGTVYTVTMKVARRVIERLQSACVRWPEPSEQEHISACWELEKHMR